MALSEPTTVRCITIGQPALQAGFEATRQFFLQTTYRVTAVLVDQLCNNALSVLDGRFKHQHGGIL